MLVKVAGVLVALVVVLLTLRWMLDIRADDLRNYPKLPCPHRFVRVRYTVVDGVAGNPQPFCGDCGDPVTGVKVRLAEDLTVNPVTRETRARIVGFITTPPKKPNPMEED